MAMAAPRKSQPKIVSMGVSYSIGVKANLGNFESADIRLSRDEKWDVSDLSPDQAKALWRERYESMKHELGEASRKEYDELLGNNLPEVENKS